jgi:hypothetical protein
MTDDERRKWRLWLIFLRNKVDIASSKVSLNTTFTEISAMITAKLDELEDES